MTHTADEPSPVVITQSETVRVFPHPVPYLVAWELQSRLHLERTQAVRPDTVLILEHAPVYTFGRSTRLSHCIGDETSLCNNGTEVHRVNRGGSVTFHGPGQVVAYPIFKLTRHASGPRALVWLLEEAMIRLLSRWNITGSRIPKKPGVWVGAPEPEKIGFIGIRIDQGVTLHGLAINVDLDLSPFQRIHPCGFSDCRITSMAAVAHTAISVEHVKYELARIFRDMFSLDQTASA